MKIKLSILWSAPLIGVSWGSEFMGEDLKPKFGLCIHFLVLKVMIFKRL
jgi:hypothetical protein